MFESGQILITLLLALASLVSIPFFIIQLRKKQDKNRRLVLCFCLLYAISILSVWWGYKLFILDEGLVDAVYKQDVNKVRRLLDLGADPDANTEIGSAVDANSGMQNKEISELLEKHRKH